LIFTSWRARSAIAVRRASPAFSRPCATSWRISPLFCRRGVILLTLFIVVYFWDTHRLLALGGVTALYLIVGLAVALTAKKKMAASPKFLSATMSEFAKDRERMSQP
jgi:uncharacterized membrane protein YqjE